MVKKKLISRNIWYELCFMNYCELNDILPQSSFLNIPILRFDEILLHIFREEIKLTPQQHKPKMISHRYQFLFRPWVSLFIALTYEFLKYSKRVLFSRKFTFQFEISWFMMNVDKCFCLHPCFGLWTLYHNFEARQIQKFDFIHFSVKWCICNLKNWYLR